MFIKLFNYFLMFLCVLFLLPSCMACVQIVFNQAVTSKIKRQLDRRICRTVIFKMVCFYAEGS